MSLLGITEKRSTLGNPSPWMMGLFGGSATASGLQVNEQSALTLSAVYACVHVLSESFGALPLNLYLQNSSGGQDVVSNLAVSNLLHTAPNDEMGPMSMKATMMGWVCTWGNAYAEIERTRGGLPLALHPLAPNRVIPRRRPGDFRIEYYVTRSAVSSPYLLEQPITDATPIDRDDMFHFAGLGFDGIMGYNPIALQRETIGAALATNQYGAKFFGNNGIPSGLLEAKGKVADPEKLREQWNKSQGGAGQRGTAVLENGVTYKQIGIPPEDSQFLETQKFKRSEICGMYRVPPHMIGDLERSTNNNIEQQAMDFVQNGLMGWIVRFEEEANRKLLTPDQRRAGYFFEFDLDARLRADIKTRYESYAIGRQWGWFSADDVLRKERQNPLPSEQGTIYMVPMNMVPAKSLLAPPEPPKDATPAPGMPAPAPQKLIATPPEADLPKTNAGSDRSIDTGKIRKNFRTMLVEAAARTVKKESQAVRRAAKKPAEFASSVRSFYADHADHIRTVLMPVATSFGDMLDVPFESTRAAVEKIAKRAGPTAITALADPKADVMKVADQWEQDKPNEIADTILMEIGL